jgi:tRNA A37 methylthiotransferase MiaB
LNANNWFPAMTLIVGNPDETDEDVKATLDLIYEVERRGLFAFFIPSIFTPLHDTRMEMKTGVTETMQLSPLQWQLMMKCWKMNLRRTVQLVGADGVASRRDWPGCTS